MAGLWFSTGTEVSTTNKNDPRDITEILLKVTLSIIAPNPNPNTTDQPAKVIF